MNLSVITTVYNCDKFIEESLQSMADQTYKNFEWIILDDGSRDMTRPYIENFISNNPNMNIIWQKDDENIKIPRRRNQAINIASGDYIAIHDGDDISLPNRLEDQINFINQNKNVFCVGGHALRIDQDGNDNGFMVYPPASHNNIVKLLQHEKKNPIIDPTTMFRRDDFLRLGSYTLDSSIYTVPDMDLWCRAILDGLILRNINKPLIKYRVNPNGMTRKHNNEMIKAHMNVINNFVRERAKRKGLENE